MTPIQTPAHLPEATRRAQSLVGTNNDGGRPAWIRTDALGVVYLYVESERK